MGDPRESKALSVARGVVRIDAAGAQRVEDRVAVEEPLEIRVAGDAVTLTMRTPGHDTELSLGLLYAEGVIRSAADVGSAVHCGHPGEEGYGNILDVRPAPGTVLDDDVLLQARRGTLITAACGVCGRRSIEDLIARCAPVRDETRFSVEVLASLPDKLRALQPAFSATGGLHAAGVADESGALFCVREDIGRHNAVDKVVGHLLLTGAITRPGRVLVVSGRTSFEVVQKAVSARFPVVVGVSAPSSLAVDTAERAGVTLVGFAREGAFNIYSHPSRIEGASPASGDAGE